MYTYISTTPYKSKYNHSVFHLHTNKIKFYDLKRLSIIFKNERVVVKYS